MGVGWTRPQRALVAWTGLLLFLTMAVLERAMGLLYVLNFSVDGPGPTALAVLLLLSGLLYPLGLARAWPHPDRVLGGAIVAGVLLLAATTVPAPRLALAAAILWHLVATPLVFAAVAALRRRAVLALAMAFALRWAVLAWTDTLPLHATAIGTLTLVALGIIWGAGWVGPVQQECRNGGRLPSPAPVWAALWAGIAFLAAPGLMSSWHGASPAAIHLGGLAGIAVGTVVVMRRPDATPMQAALGSVATLVGALWVLWNGPVPALGAALALTGMLVAVDAAMDRPRHARLARHGAMVALVQLAAVVLAFLHVVAGSWAFVAGVGPALRGQAGLLLVLLVLLVPLTAIRRGAPHE